MPFMLLECLSGDAWVKHAVPPQDKSSRQLSADNRQSYLPIDTMKPPNHQGMGIFFP